MCKWEGVDWVTIPISVSVLFPIKSSIFGNTAQVKNYKSKGAKSTTLVIGVMSTLRSLSGSLTLDWRQAYEHSM